MLPPGIQFKAVEGNALPANTHFRDIGPDLGVEEIAVHAEIAGRVAEPQHSRHQKGAASSAFGNLQRIRRTRHLRIIAGFGHPPPCKSLACGVELSEEVRPLPDVDADDADALVSQLPAYGQAGLLILASVSGR